MSLRYKGGVISATPPTPSASAATGVWTLEQQLQAEAAGNWPSQIYFGEAMRSLRFNSADSASLTRTFPSAGNRKTWTWSGWLKRTALSDTYGGALFICSSGSSDSTYTVLWFYANAIRFQAYNTLWRVTSAVYRDLSAWYHVVLALDTTQATANNRIKLYVNGSQVTDFSTTNNPNQNDDLYINSANLHRIGEGDSFYSDMYLTEVVFVDGQALTPSSFGQTNSTTGVWEPKEITGLTYGTNGFYLNFQDNSGTTSTTLGKDSSGNGNNWTPNNFSVTAGVGNDSLVDTPYSSGTDTGAGGTVRGNYTTLNPLAQSSGTFSNGNLEYSGPNNWKMAPATILLPSTGKWYAEVNITNAPYGSSFGNLYNLLGLVAPSAISTWNYNTGTSFYITDSGYYSNYNTGSSGSFTTPVSGTVLGLAVDRDTNQVTIYRNGSAVVSNITLGITSGADLFFFRGSYGPDYGMMACNFGQRPFAYTAPSGFKALCTQNLPAPTTVQPDDYFNTVTYTGNSTNSRSITGVGFQPDFVWIKANGPTSGIWHNLFDVIRGTGNRLITNNTNAAETNPAYGYLSAFGSDGFTVTGGSSGYDNVNLTSENYVSWSWKGGGAGVSNTQGTITSTVSANTTAGFSVVTYTGGGSFGATVGHGLGATPKFIVAKSRSASDNWIVYTDAVDGSQDYLALNLTDAKTDSSASSPTSTVFNPYYSLQNSTTYVAYCFAPIAGFSSVGRYTGNGSTNGPFVYTGFRPAFILIKNASSAYSWVMVDNKRSTYNLVQARIYPNSASVLGATDILDMTANGFKIRCDSGFQEVNNTNNTYIYMAFAENPFKYALAR